MYYYTFTHVIIADGTSSCWFFLFQCFRNYKKKTSFSFCFLASQFTSEWVRDHCGGSEQKMTTMGAWCLDFGHTSSVAYGMASYSYLQGQHRLVPDISMESEMEREREKQIKRRKDHQGHNLMTRPVVLRSPLMMWWLCPESRPS